MRKAPNPLLKIKEEQDRAALRQMKIERLKRLQRKLWREDPMVWLKERFKEDPLDYKWSDREGYNGHKWDGTVDPLFTAWQALADGKWTGIEAAVGVGKTFLLSRIVCWFLDCFPDSLVITTAPKQGQLTLNLWAELGKIFYKFKRIRNKAAMYNLRLVAQETDENEKDFDPDNPNLSKSWHCVGVVSGVGSDEQSATKMQGFHRKHMLIISEETPGVANAVMTALKNTCTDTHNLIIAVGNPDSQLDPLHQFCTLPNVVPVRISALDYPNVVESKSVFPGAVTQESIDRKAHEYGINSTMYNSRVRGISPAQGADSLIQLEWLKNCVEHKLEYDGTYHAVGVDVANSIDGDKAALAWGRGNHLMKIQEFQCPNATDLAYNLIRDVEGLYGKHKDYDTHKIWDYDIMNGFIGVDTVGVGIATFNALEAEGYEPVGLQGGQWSEHIPQEIFYDDDGKEKSRPMYKFQGLRSQMYWELREDLRHGRIRFMEEDKLLLRELFNELINIKVIYKDNFVVVESKIDIKKRLGGKSPNKADAVVYWNWTRKGYRVNTGGFPMLGGSM